MDLTQRGDHKRSNDCCADILALLLPVMLGLMLLLLRQSQMHLLLALKTLCGNAFNDVAL